MAISENNEIRSNLLQCPRDTNDKIFFTLMDYLNNLFMSNDPEDILRFYDYFENRDQLIKWMEERPKGNYRIVEFNNDENDIIVVIPTMDANGKFAKTCRDDIFKGLHIIFVESGIGNYYFNYAHNCNAGIKRAMEYNPKWIVLSNDDMYKIDDVDILKNELLKIKNKNFDVIFIQSSKYHSFLARIGRLRFEKFYVLITASYRTFYKKDGYYNLINSLKIEKKIKNIEKKFSIKYYRLPINNIFLKIFAQITLNKFIDYIVINDFLIFDTNYIKNNGSILFDETFINDAEDDALAIDIFINKVKYTRINYRIGDYIGSSVGTGIIRNLRSILNLAYLNLCLKNKYKLQ